MLDLGQIQLTENLTNYLDMIKKYKMECSINSRELCNKESCSVCFDRSFASHSMSEAWSEKNTFSARKIKKRSDKKAIFNCKTCWHEFECNLYSIKKSKYCPYCSNQRLCYSDDCMYCISKTCASHEMNNVWSENNILPAKKVFIQSNKLFLFNCLKCNHEYETTPNHYNERHGSCAYCDNKILCYNNKCSKCFNVSFASHHYAYCWSNKNNFKPRDIQKGSSKRAIFNCNKCSNEFSSVLYNVLTGYWCPFCKNKTEGLISTFLSQSKISYNRQLRFDWCRYSKTNNIMPFDFGLVDFKILIELDGNQHFEQVAHWESPEVVRAKDIEKIEKAIKEGYTVIHIYQEEVWKNKYKWQTILKEVLEKEYDQPQVIFISKSINQYSHHIADLTEDIKYEIINPTN